jgi:hypothetical protein
MLYEPDIPLNFRELFTDSGYGLDVFASVLYVLCVR